MSQTRGGWYNASQIYYYIKYYFCNKTYKTCCFSSSLAIPRWRKRWSDKPPVLAFDLHDETLNLSILIEGVLLLLRIEHIHENQPTGKCFKFVQVCVCRGPYHGKKDQDPGACTRILHKHVKKCRYVNKTKYVCMDAWMYVYMYLWMYACMHVVCM